MPLLGTMNLQNARGLCLRTEDFHFRGLCYTVAVPLPDWAYPKLFYIRWDIHLEYLDHTGIQKYDRVLYFFLLSR